MRLPTPASLLLATTVLVAAGAVERPASAQQHRGPMGRGMVATQCKADIAKHCADISHGQGRVPACLQQHMSDLSDACKTALQQRGPRQGRMGRGGRLTGEAMMGDRGAKGRQNRRRGGGVFAREKPYSIDDIRRIVDGRLAWYGLSRLKAGEMKEAGGNAVRVDVVTQKGEMVFRLEVNRKTGRTALIE